MIPYFTQPALSLGPITIHAFGVLVAAAVLVGVAVARRRARSTGLDIPSLDRLLVWVLVPGFLGAHLVDRLVYVPAGTLADPVSLLEIWRGLSSIGGFFGAMTGAILFARRERLGVDTWRYLDAVAYASPVGWIFGRLGCFLAYDHPGAQTDFFLGQVYEDGHVRHNLGLEEALFTMSLALLFVLLGRRPRPPGFFLALLPTLYAPFRFLADFLRVRDVRYAGLTPGQWGALGLLALGILLLARARQRGCPRTC